MDIQDIRTLKPGTVTRADICIVGSGPVGLALAMELSTTNLRLIILESGGRNSDPRADALNSIENVGAARVIDQTLVRNRGIGGTSRTWSGRLAAFDATDFRTRDWIEGSGWPISRAEFAQYLSRAASILGSTIADNTDAKLICEVLKDDKDHFDDTKLIDYLWSYSRDPNRRKDFARLGLQAQSWKLPNAAIYLNATVVQVETSADGSSVTGLEVMAPDCEKRRFAADTVILCCGGIENARILLASSRIVPSGVGNAFDQVGRYLMDHPRGPVGSYDPADFDRAQAAFSSYRPKRNGSRTVFTRGVALADSFQTDNKLLNAAAWLNGKISDDDPVKISIEVMRGRLNEFFQVRELFRASNLATNFKRLIHNRGPIRRLDWLNLECIVEQPPRYDSRVRLASQLDGYGVPLSRIDWKVGEEEAQTVRALARAFRQESERLGLPLPRLHDWILDEKAEFALVDCAHPSGTTRMSSDPRSGVVDSNCAVHGVNGLYIAGSSIFPTSGHANPTQTAVALAIRLADYLKIPPKTHLVVSTPVNASKLGVSCAGLPKVSSKLPMVLVTGASGKIGSVIVRKLVDRGYRVRALSSRFRQSDNDQVQWISRDLRQRDFDFTRELDGCIGVVHAGAELNEPADMWKTNVEATRSIARAAESAGALFMIHLSSVSVYGSSVRRSVDESSPTISPHIDRKSEYWADAPLRAYGRTKLNGEMAIFSEARSVEYVIFRPTVVVDEEDVSAILSWNLTRRMFVSYRNAHHIYVGDVADACIWAIDRSLKRNRPSPGVTIYNLSDNSLTDPSFGGLFRLAYDHPKLRYIRRAIELPWLFDWGKDYVRYRGRFPRRLLGQMYFPNRLLLDSGFRLPRGMNSVRAAAIAMKADRVDGSCAD